MMRNNKGITMITLVVTIVIMMILIITVSANMSTTIELNRYNNVKEDIISLTEAVKMYYLQNGVLPVFDGVYLSSTNEAITNIPNEDKNPNDLGDYYYIRDSLLEDVQLHYGFGNKGNGNFYTNDVYIVNEASFTVYYVKGVSLGGKRHYTIVDDFKAGSFAEDYYAKANVPIISVVTMQTTNENKNYAAEGDTITLNILSNYEFEAGNSPTVTINDTNVNVEWNGKIGKATYVVPEITDPSKINQKVPFLITKYSANGKNGLDIKNVTFGEDLYLKKTLSVGDYVDYTYDSTSNYILETTYSGYSRYQSIEQKKDLLWRVLSIDGNKVELISETPTQVDVYFNDANGYNNGVYILNDICEKQYSNRNFKTVARSINIEDLENAMSITGKNILNNISSDAGIYGNVYTSGNGLYYPAIFASEIGAGINTKSVKVTGLAKSEKSEIDTYNGKTAASSSLSAKLNNYNMYTYSNYFNTSLYDILIKDKIYWIASRRTTYYSDSRLAFQLGLVSSNYIWSRTMMFSDGETHGGGWSLRPIVTIEGNLKIDTTETSNIGTKESPFPIIFLNN